MGTSRRAVLLACCVGLIGSWGGGAAAAYPPDRVNYQGVLRDALDAPLSGSYDMVFDFWSLAAGGDHILRDSHAAGSGGSVTLSGGLFNVALGSGAISDGSGPGVYSSLAQVFRDYGTVWLEVQVGGETLSPRTRIESAPYSINSGHLEGLASNRFLRSDASTTFSSGTLTTESGTTLRVNGYFYLNYPHLFINNAGPDRDQSIRFFDNGLSDDEYLGWEESADRFFLSDDLRVLGSLLIAPGYAPSNYTHNVITNGTPTPDSGAMDNIMDLYLQGDLEVDSALYLNGQVWVDDDGPDADQTIWFFDGGVPSGQWFRWENGNGRFLVSAGLAIRGDLRFEDTVDTVRYIRNTYDLSFVKDTDSDNNDAWFRFWTDNAFYEQMRINDGDEAAVLFDGAVSANALDYAEAFAIDDPAVEPGDVVALVPGRPDLCRKATAGDPHLLGVVSARPGFVTGLSFQQEEQADAALAAQRAMARAAGDTAEEKRLTRALNDRMRETTRPVALLGRVPVKVAGPVAAGDRLTASSVSGFAAPLGGPGPSVGVALEAWAGPGPGTVLAYIQAGWVGGEAFPQLEVSSAPADEGAAAGTPDLASARDTSGAPAGAHQALATLEGGLAQEFPAAEVLEVGDVVVADRSGGAGLRRGTLREDPAVVGIVVTSAGVVTESPTDAQRLELPPRVAVALAGAVPCRVDASFGAVQVGDLLVVSSTPGHAMRATDPAPGTVLGKALEALAGGRGTIRVLVLAR